MVTLIFHPDMTPVDEHPAVKAWQQLWPSRRLPDAIETPRTRSGKPLRKTSIYRLHGIGAGGAAVIAKRSGRSSMLIERMVYEEVLTKVPVPAVRCYGFLDEPQQDTCWLFLEDAEAEHFSASLLQHRVLAAQWLGVVHPATARLEVASRLPRRHLDAHRADVSAAQQAITRNLANPALDREDRLALQWIIDDCAATDANWRVVEQLWNATPCCLVHGDFTNKNVRVRRDAEGPVLLAIDWETAGWGVPAVDLAAVEPEVYWSCVRSSWDGLSLDQIRKLRTIGILLLNIGFVAAIASGLETGSVQHAASVLHEYQPLLRHAIRELGWMRLGDRPAARER